MNDLPRAAAGSWQAQYLKRLSKLSRNQLLALALQLKQQISPSPAQLIPGEREPIAVIGAGCRLPGGVVDLESYWDLLRAGRNGIVDMRGQRWDMQAFFDADPDAGGRIHARHCGLLEQIDAFDADFFTISPREAESMDPQQRLLLEVTWEAIETSGHATRELERRAVGVFVGMMNKDYLHLLAPDITGSEAKHSPYYASGEAFSIAAGRLSYVLGLHGPCMTLDTACSSSLVAVHLACQSLRAGECEMALAGGTSLIASPEASIVSSNARMLSASGRCWTFDERADGYVRSEGCAMVLLKPLSLALADRNPILGTIVASAVNHDGRSQGLTAPSTAAQIALMQAALRDGGLTPEHISYIEAHGTGTPLGDPIEMSSIQAVYGASRSAAQPLYVGSVKTNIGHAEASAGISGLLKLLLCASHREIVPHRNFNNLNPHITLQEGVSIATRNERWGEEGATLTGAVNSFGFSGTNAHIIVQTVAPQPDNREPARPADAHPRLLTLSAANEPALRELASRYRAYLARHGEVNLDDLAFTTNVGRDHFRERLAVSASTQAQLCASLDAWLSNPQNAHPTHCWRGSLHGDTPDAVLAFSGLGDGAAAALETLRQGWGVFANHLQDLTRHLPTEIAARFADRLADPPAPAAGPAHDSIYCCLLGLVTWRTLKSVGARFAALAGLDPLGRVTAACCAGALEPATALRIAALPEAERAATLSSAAVQKPDSVVLALDTDANRVIPLRDSESLRGFLLCDESTQQDRHINGAEASAPGEYLWVHLGDLTVGQAPTAATTCSQSVLMASNEARQPSLSEALLATLYTVGVTLDWPGLYRDRRCQRLSLPTYAFQRRRYWPDNAKTRALFESSTDSASPLSYGLNWQEISLERQMSAEARRRVVLLTETSSAAAILAAKGPSLAIKTLPVDWHDHAVLGPILDALDLDSPAEPVDLVVWLAAAHLLMPEAPPEEAADVDIIQRASHVSEGLLHLTQHLLSGRDRANIRLLLVTEGAELVAGYPSAHNLADAGAGGLLRCLSLEQPQWRPRLLDLDPLDTADRKQSQILQAVYQERHEPWLSVRAGRWFARRLTAQTPIMERASDSATGWRATAEGAYLITGGLGGVGLSVARWLADSGAGEIILLARRSPDERTQHSIDELRASGVRVQVAAADVADFDTLQNVLEQSVTRPLVGIFHAAGVLHDGLVQNLAAAHFQQVLRPKLTGTLNLQRLAEGHCVELFVLFGSIASVIGSAGQANYAFANGFLTAFAELCRARGRPATLIHWGPWAEAGMAADERTQRKLQQAGLPALPVAAALYSLGQTLQASGPQTVIARIDWSQVARYLQDRNPQPLLQDFLPTVAAPQQEDNARFRTELIDKPPAAALQQMTRYVVATLRKVLGIAATDPFDERRALQDFGMDSLLSVELRNRFATTLTLNLPVSLMFDYPSAAAIASHLLEQLRLQGQAGELTPAASSARAQALTAARPDGDPSREQCFPADQEDIAIIGIGCRMPGGADGVEAFWQKLLAAEDLVSAFDDSRWSQARFYQPGSLAEGQMYSNQGGQIQGVHLFDNHFFEISDREAEHMDPQQRIALEVAWETLECAGYTPAALAAEGGIFIGPGPSDFADLSQRHARALNGLMGPGHHVSAIAGRIAYLLNWQGPCLTVDTACSSSLVAIHLAIQHLRQHECRVALAGGVNVILSPANNIVLSKAGMLSPTGRCRTFDRDADGYVRSDGCGLVLLKRLSEAVAEGDVIWGVIKSTAVNHNGSSQGLTAPSGRQQAALMNAALQRARIHARDVTYVEAHGTGTQLGDPIEVGALMEVYGQHHDAQHPLYIGSVKSNLGHTESAAGVAGLLKVLLMIRSRTVVPNLHLRTLNPLFSLDATAVRMVTEPQALPFPENGPVNCAVSSFGFSGTNAHLILQSPPPRERPEAPAECGMFALAARTPRALARLGERYLAYLALLPEAASIHSAQSGSLSEARAFANLCYTTLVGRSHFAHAVCLYPENAQHLGQQLRELLEAIRQGQGVTAPASLREVCFHFSSDTPMAQLDAAGGYRQPLLQSLWAEIDHSVHEVCGFSPSRQEWNATVHADPEGARRLTVFSAQLALGRLLRTVGIEPHSLSCADPYWLTAAALFGVLPLEDAIGRLLSGERAGAAPNALLDQLPRMLSLGEPPRAFLTTVLTDGQAVSLLPAARPLGTTDLLHTLGTLWTHGQTIDFSRFFQHSKLQRVALPTYPFERRDCSRRQRLPAGEIPTGRLLELAAAQ